MNRLKRATNKNDDNPFSKRFKQHSKKSKIGQMLADITNQDKVFNGKPQKISTKRLNVERGIFGYAEHSGLVKRVCHLSEKSQAILNEDLFQIIDLTKRSSAKPSSEQRLGSEVSAPDGAESPESIIDLCTPSPTRSTERSLFQRIEEKYKNGEQECGSECEFDDDLLQELVDNSDVNPEELNDNWNIRCDALFAYKQIPDYERLLIRNILDHQNLLTRASVVETLRKHSGNPLTDYRLRREFVKRFNKLAAAQDLPVEPLNMATVGSVSLDLEDERQVVPRSPEIAPERCKTPVMEMQFSEDSYFTPENQRYVYKEPETERYQTCLYMRTESSVSTTSNPENFVDIYIKGDDNPGPTLFEINCDNATSFGYDTRMESSVNVAKCRPKCPRPASAFDVSPKSSQPRFTIGSHIHPKFDIPAKSVYMSASAKTENKMEVDSKFSVEFKSMSIENYRNEQKRQRALFNFERSEKIMFSDLKNVSSKCYEVKDIKVQSEFEYGRKHALSDSCSSDSFLMRPRKVCKRSTHLKDRNCIEDMCNSPILDDRDTIMSRRKLNYANGEYFDQENMEPVPLNTYPESPKTHNNDFKGFVKPRYTPTQYRFRKKAISNMFEKALSPNEYSLRTQFLPETITSDIERKMHKLSESRGLVDFPNLPETPNIEFHAQKF